MNCLTESQLRLVLERRGGLGMIPGADEHLDECELCRAVVAGLAQDASTSEERTDCSHGNAKEEALSRSLSIGAVIADRYVVLEVIGIGGMGIVYAAYDRRLDRKIALKMLRPSISAQDRLVKEAQNLARLSHPNVVVVHDVGQFMGQTYMAMEYVDGLNLRKWKEIERPSAERILDVYLKAARGLAAAHAAGLVHRDVKPENIVLGHDDRVRVVDFGLADVEHPGEDEAGVTGSAGASHGKLEGTALYMAPELYRGQVADARSDQFGFCVALHEALFGQHPFRFTRLQELSEAMQLGHFRELPRDRRVDRALRAVLLRGLSADPAARYESVDALCKALQHTMQRKRRRIIAAISVFCTVLVCAALVALGRTPPPPPPCADSERLLADIWNASKREQLARVFGETKLVYADSAATTVNAALDRFAKRWTDAHAETCRATRVYHEQSEEVMDLRMACLDRRRIEFRIMTERPLTANAATVEKAAEAAHQLPGPEWCDKAHVQSEQVPPPNADVAAQVRALQLRLASVEAMIRLGHDVEAFQTATQLAEEAEKLQYAPLQAEVGLALGGVSAGRINPEERRKGLWKTLALAEASNQQRIVMAVWGWIGRDALWQSGDNEQALRAADMMGVLATKLGDVEAGVRASILRMSVFRSQSKNNEGLTTAIDAVARCEANERCSQSYLYRALNQLAIMYGITNQLEKSLETFDRAHRLAQSLLGDDHPFIAAALNDRSSVLIAHKRHVEALEIIERVIAMSGRNGVHRSFLYAPYTNAAESWFALGKYEQAEVVVAKAISICVETGIGNQAQVMNLYALQGDIRFARSQYEAAVESYVQAIEMGRNLEKKDAQVEIIARAREKLRLCARACMNARKTFDGALKAASQ